MNECTPWMSWTLFMWAAVNWYEARQNIFIKDVNNASWKWLSKGGASGLILTSLRCFVLKRSEIHFLVPGLAFALLSMKPEGGIH